MTPAPDYGNAPLDLGLVDLSPVEMMCWVYCPIKARGKSESDFVIPPNLRQYTPLLHRIYEKGYGPLLKWRYVYITAKTLWVTPDNPGNRPGWHSDGFMTDDLNFIWSDSNPTVFWEPPYDNKYQFIQDHHASLAEMDFECERTPEYHKTYPNKHLLLLDETVMHKVAPVKKAGFRTFVKISVSEHEYNLLGNSINHDLNLGWEYVAREEERNHPIGKS
jgi:hypothetical protein